MGQTVHVPQEVIALLELREGFRTVVYYDTATPPNLTSGMGHKLTPSECHLYPKDATVPPDVLEAWTESDSEAAYIAALSQARQIVCQDQRLINALACVSFQLGSYWYGKFPKTWAHLHAHEWELAAQDIAKSKWYEQTPVRVEDFQRVLRSLDTPVAEEKEI